MSDDRPLPCEPRYLSPEQLRLAYRQSVESGDSVFGRLAETRLSFLEKPKVLDTE